MPIGCRLRAGVERSPGGRVPHFGRALRRPLAVSSAASVMAIVKPFRALRPNSKLASRICELPYDVLSSAEARICAAGNPHSFFHVSKPEIDLEPSVGLYEPEVYARGRESFRRMISEGSLQQDGAARYYLYRQVMGRHAQVGLVAVTSCGEYLSNTIRKHELTRPDKEDDRVRHIEALNAQTGPAFLVYTADPELDRLFAETAQGAPDVDFVAADGVRHTSWTIGGRSAETLIESRFAAMPALYIADGHHRSAAAARVYQARQGRGESGLFLSVLFPHNQVQILPYHRVLSDLNSLTPAALLEKLDAVFAISPSGRAQPDDRHEVGLFLEGRWRRLRFRPQFTAATDPLESLDVTLLQKHVLAPLFGIQNPRTSERIQFVGGIRGTPELERLVNSGEFACAFALYPTRVEDLMAIAEQGGLMPPKSTWFEPKLRDGMFSHLLD